MSVIIPKIVLNTQRNITFKFGIREARGIKRDRKRGRESERWRKTAICNIYVSLLMEDEDVLDVC